MLPYMAYMDPMGYGIFTSKDRGIELFFDVKTMDGAVTELAEWESNESETTKNALIEFVRKSSDCWRGGD